TAEFAGLLAARRGKDCRGAAVEGGATSVSGEGGAGGDMEYVICYDLSDDARRERLASTLLDYGKRIQESVFMAHLDDELHARMMERIGRVIDEELDCVHVFSVCEACSGKTRVLGKGEIPEDRRFIVI